MNIEEIRARCEAATPGPWYWDVIDSCKCIALESARWKVMDFARYGMNGAAPRFLVDGIMERADTLLKSIPGKEHHRGFDNYIDHPDAAFIAHARTDIPALLAEVERLTHRNEELELFYSAYDGSALERADDHIEKLECDVAQLTARAENAEADRDAAVADFTNYVQGKDEVCAYCINDDMCEPGETMCVGFGRKAFEWRGVQKEGDI